MQKIFDAGSRILIMSCLILAQFTYFIPITIIPITMASVPPQQWDFHQGNWTYVSKPGFPVNIPRNYIGINESRTYVYNLSNDSQYHVYFYGKWVMTNSTTDYDVFVYDPSGVRETYHTESAGLIEHLGTTVNQPFFKPKKEGNYSILILNDPKESQDAENGTLMVIEHLDVNRMYKNKMYMEGKDSQTDKSGYRTMWVYEFNSSSKHIEIPVDVPETLDMYEVRLYLMANPNVGLGSDLLGIPLAWEPGLYNKTSQGVGGCNVNFTAYRGNAFDSCEYPGEDMLINYTSPYDGNSLYHLVFIAELGSGNLSYVIKTDLTKPSLNVSKPSIVNAGEETVIMANSNDTESGIENVNLFYSVDDGLNWKLIQMPQDSPQIYKAGIPGQLEGTTVRYRIEAQDCAGNKAIEEGSYQSKSSSKISLKTSATKISGGGSLNVTGSITPVRAFTNVLIQYVNPLGYAIEKTLKTDSGGQFNDTYVPDMGGTWRVLAKWNGDSEFTSTSNGTNLTVEKITHIINMSVDNNRITLGGKLQLSGMLSPALSNVEVNIVITDPNGNSEIKKATTSSQGTYSLTFEPNTKGTWNVTAVFGGNNLHRSTSSNSFSFETVEPFNLLFIIAPLAIVIIVGVIVGLRKAMGSSEKEY